MYIVLYEKIYNENICCHYIRRYIMTTNILIIHKMYIVLYETMYNENICCHYTRRRIMTTNIS